MAPKPKKPKITASTTSIAKTRQRRKPKNVVVTLDTNEMENEDILSSQLKPNQDTSVDSSSEINDIDNTSKSDKKYRAPYPFTDEQKIELIEWYRDIECLWKKDAPGYSLKACLKEDNHYPQKALTYKTEFGVQCESKYLNDLEKTSN